MNNPTIPYLLSGTPESDEALRVLVAEARGWRRNKIFDKADQKAWAHPDGHLDWQYNLPPFSTSLDATRELLEDLTEEELEGPFSEALHAMIPEALWQNWKYPLLATARKISVAWLIVKGFLK